MSERSLRTLLEETGFRDVAFLGLTGYRTSSRTQGARVVATKPS